jgi:putative ABC transport system permease protein
MELGSILKGMTRNWVGPMLVALQVGITMAVMTNSVFVIKERMDVMARATGVDEANLGQLGMFAYADKFDWQGELRADLEALNSHPGVRAAGTINSLPGSGSGWSSTWLVEAGKPETAVQSAMYMVDERGLETLGVELTEGRWFRQEEIIDVDPTGFEGFFPGVILTESLAQRMFPDGALGRIVHTESGDQAPVVGIVRRMAVPWPQYLEWEDSTLLPGRLAGPALFYAVRAEPGALERVLPEVEELLAARTTGRTILKPRTHREIVAEEFSDERATVRILVVIMILLVLLTGLGIVGLASFNVRRRTRQIGTRRALGATRSDILKYFLSENAVLTGVGLIIGVVLTYALNVFLAEQFNVARVPGAWLILGMVALLALGQLAVLGPARAATRIPPAVATRTV